MVARREGPRWGLVVGLFVRKTNTRPNNANLRVATATAPSQYFSERLRPSSTEHRAPSTDHRPPTTDHCHHPPQGREGNWKRRYLVLCDDLTYFESKEVSQREQRWALFGCCVVGDGLMDASPCRPSSRTTQRPDSQLLVDMPLDQPLGAGCQLACAPTCSFHSQPPPFHHSARRTRQGSSQRAR